MEADHRRAGRADLRGAARLYASGGNGAIYYGLGVTEHSQGSTMVMGIANLAMATGNIGREGVGVNPLRGQNNVQGSCDMGSFPHELPGYRHVSDAAVRALFESDWGVTLDSEPGLRIPNMFDAALDGTFKGLYVQGEDIAQSDPNTQHVTAALERAGMPGRAGHVPERDGEVRARVPAGLVASSKRTAPSPTPSAASRACARSCRRWPAWRTGKSRWRCPMRSAIRCTTTIRREIMDEIARLTPTFPGVTYEKIDELGSIQWPCNDAGAGRHADHARRRVRARQGQVRHHRVRADRGAHQRASIR